MKAIEKDEEPTFEDRMSMKTLVEDEESAFEDQKLAMALVEDEESKFESQEEHWDQVRRKQRAIKSIRCGNAGEDMKKLQNGYAMNGITLKYTELNTPQQKGVSREEKRFGSDRDRALGANDEVSGRDKQEERSMVGNMKATNNRKFSDELYTATKRKNERWLIQFGRNGYVKRRTKNRKTMVNKTIECINLGPTEEDSAGCYWLNNSATETTVHSKEIRWVDWKRSNPTQDLACCEGKIPRAGTGKEAKTYESKEDSLDNTKVHDLPETYESKEASLDNTKVHDLRETPAWKRATSTAGRTEEGGAITAERILGAVKDTPEKAARAQRSTYSKAERIQSDTLKHAAGKADQMQRMDINEAHDEREPIGENTGPHLVSDDEDEYEYGREYEHADEDDDSNSDYEYGREYEHADEESEDDITDLMDRADSDVDSDSDNDDIVVVIPVERADSDGDSDSDDDDIVVDSNDDNDEFPFPYLPGLYVPGRTEQVQLFYDTEGLLIETEATVGADVIDNEGWKNEHRVENATMAIVENEEPDVEDAEDWLIDSGATVHETHDARNMFWITYTDTGMTESLKLCDGCSRAKEKLRATETSSPSVAETEEITTEETTAEGTTIMRQVHCGNNAAVTLDPRASATTDETLSGQENKQWQDSAMAEINKKWKKIKRKVQGSKKKIKSDKDVAEKRSKIVPLKWKFKKTIEPTFVKASMNAMAETIVEDYETHVGRSIKSAKTPGFTCMTLRNGEDDEAEGGIDMEEYKTLAGKSLHYDTKLAQDCANAAKELSQCMARPSQEHWRARERLNGYMNVRIQFMKGEVTVGKVTVLTDENESDILTRNVNDKQLFQHLARDLLSGTLRNWIREDEEMAGLSSDRRVGTPAIMNQDESVNGEWNQSRRAKGLKRDPSHTRSTMERFIWRTISERSVNGRTTSER
jgi:hypothetical protein